jgi:ankyrin repeat protein
LTPLHYACKNKHLEGISCLLEHGADANMQDNVSTATSGVAVMVEMVVVVVRDDDVVVVV